MKKFKHKLMLTIAYIVLTGIIGLSLVSGGIVAGVILFFYTSPLAAFTIGASLLGLGVIITALSITAAATTAAVLFYRRSAPVMNQKILNEADKIMGEILKKQSNKKVKITKTQEDIIDKDGNRKNEDYFNVSKPNYPNVIPDITKFAKNKRNI